MLINESRIDLTHAQLMQFIRYLFYSGIYLLCVLLLFEIFIRLFVYGPGPNYVFDSDLGYRYGGGTRIFNGIEGFGTVDFVADGEIATPYSGGKNVVVLGDSHTQAIQVDDINNFESIAEEILHDEGYSVDLHNYGGTGARIPDYIYLASYIKQRYRPEVMVIQVSVDDFFGNSFASDQPSHFVVSADGTLALEHNTPTKKHISFLETLNRYSALTTFAYERLYKISYLMRNDNKQDDASSQSDQVSIDVMKMEVQALADVYPDIPIIIILLPLAPQIQNSHILFHENEYYQVLAKTIQNTEGLYLIDPLPAFNGLVQEGKLPRGFLNTTPGKGHLNVNGHEIVGTLLTSMLIQIMK